MHKKSLSRLLALIMALMLLATTALADGTEADPVPPQEEDSGELDPMEHTDDSVYVYLKLDENGSGPANWVFLGQGEKTEDGKVKLPDAGTQQKFVVNNDNGDSIIITVLPDIDKDDQTYSYYAGEGKVTDEFTYSIQLDKLTNDNNGFNIYVAEDGQSENYRFFVGWTWHANVTGTYNTNHKVVYEVKDYLGDSKDVTAPPAGDAAPTAEEQWIQWVLGGTAKDNLDQAVTDELLEKPEDASLNSGAYEFKWEEVKDEENGKVSYRGVYQEKSYTVTYQWAEGSAVPENIQASLPASQTYGKAEGHGHTAAGGYDTVETETTRYTFAGWVETTDENGNVTYTGTWTSEDISQPDIIITTPDIDGFPFFEDAPTATIADEETPLAGILALADLLNALYEHEGIEAAELPEGFKWPDHVYAQAIRWGLEEQLVTDTEDDPLDPDELLTVGLMREVLVNFAELYKGLDSFQVTAEGEDEDLVLDLGERLTAFYVELEEALKEQEKAA